jgi:hypothetical protein
MAMLDPTTGEVVELRLEDKHREARMFYATLPVPATTEIER